MVFAWDEHKNHAKPAKAPGFEEENGEEVIRIISARKASARERAPYNAHQ
jgi:uncharacterized DUF497 family protein